MTRSGRARPTTADQARRTAHTAENRLPSERARLGRRSAPGLGRAPSARRRRVCAWPRARSVGASTARRCPRAAAPRVPRPQRARHRSRRHHAAAVAAAAAARLLVVGSPAADADLFDALEGLLLHEQQASSSTSSVAAWPAWVEHLPPANAAGTAGAVQAVAQAGHAARDVFVPCVPCVSSCSERRSASTEWSKTSILQKFLPTYRACATREVRGRCGQRWRRPEQALSLSGVAVAGVGSETQSSLYYHLCARGEWASGLKEEEEEVVWTLTCRLKLLPVNWKKNYVPLTQPVTQTQRRQAVFNI